MNRSILKVFNNLIWRHILIFEILFYCCNCFWQRSLCFPLIIIFLCFYFIQVHSVSVPNLHQLFPTWLRRQRSLSSLNVRWWRRAPVNVCTTYVREPLDSRQPQSVLCIPSPGSAACTLCSTCASLPCCVMCDWTWLIAFRFHRDSRSISNTEDQQSSSLWWRHQFSQNV